MSKETWKTITDKAVKGYEVSDAGRVRNSETQTVLKSFDGKLVVFSVKGKAICRSVGKLVASAFIGPVKKGTRVHRIDQKRAFTLKNIRVGGKTE